MRASLSGSERGERGLIRMGSVAEGHALAVHQEFRIELPGVPPTQFYRSSSGIVLIMELARSNVGVGRKLGCSLCCKFFRPQYIP